MRWLCPQCRRAISFAFRECPFCQKTESATDADTGAAGNLAVQASAKAVPIAKAETLEIGVSSPPKLAAPSGDVVVRKLVPAPDSPPARPLRVLVSEKRESQLYRGFRFGLGVALALVVIVLLLFAFWLWWSGGGRGG